MYPKKKKELELLEIDELNAYDEGTIAKEMEEGVLTAAEEGFMRGNNLGNTYEEEEEAEE